ncbi:hypothetical protein ACJQWK_00399 [Exserohilum turcicum]|uniref:Uncharacterized protein n=1 Tax=Exserohilum turcicum (strain 28A) TaxID=671987 RepID=R0K0I2_EXST2|nr:uncharacterized protein SETTUDRAFT_33505 [Exserohilum turcica Et28A]EOA83189.1 hypothetical protein SETTUDRAFT_33505 [Exserohilum turcica Et28A]
MALQSQSKRVLFDAPDDAARCRTKDFSTARHGGRPCRDAWLAFHHPTPANKLVLPLPPTRAGAGTGDDQVPTAPVRKLYANLARQLPAILCQDVMMIDDDAHDTYHLACHGPSSLEWHPHAHGIPEKISIFLGHRDV